ARLRSACPRGSKTRFAVMRGLPRRLARCRLPARREDGSSRGVWSPSTLGAKPRLRQAAAADRQSTRLRGPPDFRKQAFAFHSHLTKLNRTSITLSIKPTIVKLR